MKRIIICLAFVLSACAVPQENDVQLEERAAEPQVFEAPVMVAPMDIPLCPEVAAGDGIGGTGCK